MDFLFMFFCLYVRKIKDIILKVFLYNLNIYYGGRAYFNGCEDEVSRRVGKKLSYEMSFVEFIFLLLLKV